LQGPVNAGVVKEIRRAAHPGEILETQYRQRRVHPVSGPDR
jgi:hypothetical protein